MSVPITPKNRFVEAFISLVHGDYEGYLNEISKKTVRYSCYKHVLV